MDDDEPRYLIEFEFDAEGDPPKVLIADRPDGGRGGLVIEVLEEPICTNGSFSWDPNHWHPGPLAEHLVTLLNTNPLPPDE